jgi:O-antigen/teichoic acid export membrane protein
LWILFSGVAAREGYFAAADQAVISISNFLATIILARNVDPTQLGIYGVGFVTLRLIRSLQEGFLIQPLNVFGAPMDDEHFKSYATSTSLLQILFALFTALVVAVVGTLLTTMGNDVAGPTLYGLWFAFLTWQMQEYLRRMLYTRGAVLNATINTVIANAARLALMAFWAAEGKLTGVAGLQAIAWGSLVALIPGIWFTRRWWTIHFENLWQTWQRNWNFGRWMLSSTVGSWVSIEFYPVLTAGLISFAAAGAYRALQNLVAPIHALLRATDTFLTPRAARSYRENDTRALARILRHVYIITGIPTLAILGIAVLFPKQLLYLLYGDTYLPYSNGMILMAIFYGLWFAYAPLQAALKAARITRPVFIANIAAMVAMFSVGLLLIQTWEVYGTIAGQGLNALIVNVILWGTWIKVMSKAGRATEP